jgi:hypothetical protein
MEFVGVWIIIVGTYLKIFAGQNAEVVVFRFGNGVRISECVCSNLNFAPGRMILVELIFDDL